MGSYNIAYYMNRGLRGNQEDCIFIHGETIQEDIMLKPSVIRLNGEMLVLAVCDGMGGLKYGKWASRFICEKLGECLPDIENHGLSIEQALKRIQTDMQAQEMQNAGSTITGIILRENRAEVFNAGDSRTYKISDVKIHRLSHDHSLVQDAIDNGHISYEESATHLYRHVITFGMGDVFRDLWARNHKIYVTVDTAQKKDKYLMCTDGLHDIFEDEELIKTLGPKPFEKTDGLIDIITEKMKDNVSFILIEVE